MKRELKLEMRMTKSEKTLQSLSVRRRASCAVVTALLLSMVSGLAEQTNRTARPDESAVRMISDRNIFNPNRFARSSGRTSRTESRPASRVESFTLVGLMAYEKGVFAFFDGTSASYRKTLETEGTISEFKIAGLNSHQVKLVSGTNEFTLRVGMQVRREDEGDWFLSEPGQASRNRVVVSRGRTRTANAEGATDLPEGAIEPGMEAEPEILVVEPERTPEGAEGNGEAATATTEPNNSNGITDPVLLRLMQRRQELNQ